MYSMARMTFLFALGSGNRTLGQRSMNSNERTLNQNSINSNERTLGQRSMNSHERTIGQRLMNGNERKLGQRSMNNNERKHVMSAIIMIMLTVCSFFARSKFLLHCCPLISDIKNNAIYWKSSRVLQSHIIYKEENSLSYGSKYPNQRDGRRFHLVWIRQVILKCVLTSINMCIVWTMTYLRGTVR